MEALLRTQQRHTQHRSDSSEETSALLWLLVIAALALTMKLLPEYLAWRACPDCQFVPDHPAD